MKKVLIAKTRNFLFVKGNPEEFDGLAIKFDLDTGKWQFTAEDPPKGWNELKTGTPYWGLAQILLSTAKREIQKRMQKEDIEEKWIELEEI